MNGLIARYRDGGLLFNERWDRFSVQWRTSAPHERVILDDGRPAIRREPNPIEPDGEVTYVTLASALWDTIKKRQKAAFAMEPPPPRTRLCQACRAEMKVSREYEAVWCFRCEACGSSETWGKDVLGGTQGSGEKEKR